MSTDFAERARALVGTRFRPQGRGSEGMDCVGVAMAVFDVPAENVRRDYRIRGDHEAEIRAWLANLFCRVRRNELRSGDLMLMRVAKDQLHLGVRTERGFVHAHAGVKRVVETPGIPEWPLAAVYRKRRI